MNKILKFKIFNLKLQKGYTLAELLAVISILVVISVAVSSIIFSTLRGSSKTRITTEVSQNGEYALSIISAIIADSRNITQVNGSDIDDCTTPNPTPAGNPSITLKRMDGRTTRISCQTISGVYTVASNGASLLNVRTVKAASCSFSCTQVVQDPYSIPIVNVSFNVSEVGVGQFESKSSANFNGSSSLRVYSP